jgi:hypothetical protein
MSPEDNLSEANSTTLQKKDPADDKFTTNTEITENR